MLDVAKPASGSLSQQIGNRLLDFATATISLSNRLGRTAVTRYIATQLVRSACSAGANYQESRGAESRADFVHKMQLVLKESRESLYWLTLIERSRILPRDAVSSLVLEANELVSILVKAVTTAKSRNRTV